MVKYRSNDIVGKYERTLGQGEFFMVSFVASQVRTYQHQIAIWSIPFIIISGYFNPYMLWIGLALFFFVTSFKLLKSIIMWFLIILGLTIVFPPLAPFIFILMIIFFFIRIGYVIQHWRPFLYGLVFYSLMTLIIFDSWEYYQYNYSYISYYFESILYTLDYYWVYPGDIVQLVISFSLAIISSVMLHFMLKNCYKNGYESYVALGIMGSVPLIIISFLLPFLKIQIGDVFMGDTYVAKDPVVPTEKKYVAPYVRTAPDSIAQNNFSYDGPDKIGPNTETVQVKGYWRSVPGESTNVEVREPLPAHQSSESNATLTPGYEKRKREKTNEQK